MSFILNHNVFPFCLAVNRSRVSSTSLPIQTNQIPTHRSRYSPELHAKSQTSCWILPNWFSILCRDKFVHLQVWLDSSRFKLCKNALSLKQICTNIIAPLWHGCSDLCWHQDSGNHAVWKSKFPNLQPALACWQQILQLCMTICNQTVLLCWASHMEHSQSAQEDCVVYA